MPKRTNDFQQLVKLVQQGLAPQGAVVRESVAEDTVDGPREIDVLLESAVGIYRLKIAVEAKGHSRPIDVEIVEQIAAKFRPGDGIAADKVVIVSKAGFTKKAKAKAARTGFELLTLKEAETTDWTQFMPQGKSQTMRFAIAPQIDIVSFEPAVPGSWPGLGSARLFCTCHGFDHGCVRDLVNQMLRSIFNNREKRRQTEQVLDQTGCAILKLRHPLSKRELHLDGKVYPVTGMNVAVRFAKAEAPMRFTTYEQTSETGASQLLQHAVAEVLGKKIQLLFPNGLASERVILDVRDMEK